MLAHPTHLRVSKVKINKLILFFVFLWCGNEIQAQATGTCTVGSEYCEGVNTTNTTTTNNTNQNTNQNTNNNTNTSTSTSTATNTNYNNNSSTATSTNNNNNTSTSTSTSTNNNNNNSTSNNTNTNYNNSNSNSTVNSTVDQTVNNNTTTNNTNSNYNESNSTSNNTNTNNNYSESNSNVNTNNTNINENNTTSNNTNRNINESKSEQVITQNVNTKAPPASAIAPSIMSYSQDLCTTGLSAAYQGQIFGFSGGKSVRDENCERLKLSKYVYDMGMKVAAVALLCQDERVFSAMWKAGTPCPYDGKIGDEAKAEWVSNAWERPDRIEAEEDFLRKCMEQINPNWRKRSWGEKITSPLSDKPFASKYKSRRQCLDEFYG
jgi:DNA polymerase III alpha subunit (gram-positive type)